MKSLASVHPIFSSPPLMPGENLSIVSPCIYKKIRRRET